MGDEAPSVGSNGAVRVRMLSSDEWRIARDARLAALRDAPLAFLARMPAESKWNEELWRRSYETGWWAVAESSNSVVGLARLSYNGEAPHLESVWTHPRHRRQGIASALVRSLLTELLERGPGEVFVWVIHPNPAAYHLYLSLGFEPTNERQTLDGLDRVEERLRLTAQPR